MRYSVVLSVQPAGFAAATFQGELDENLAAIAQLGYAGVELAVRDPRSLDPDRLAAVVERHGLAVSAIGTGQAFGEEGLSLSDPDSGIRRAASERLRAHLPLARRLGALVIIGLIRGCPAPQRDRQQALGWLRSALEEVCQAAADLGVRLALEPINRYETSLIHTAAEGLEFVAQVGMANLGLLLDTFHMNIEERCLADAIEQAGPKLFHVHVADSNRHPPGSGHLDFGAILHALAATGYAGWVSGEFLAVPDPRSAARAAIEHLGTVWRRA